MWELSAQSVWILTGVIRIDDLLVCVLNSMVFLCRISTGGQRSRQRWRCETEQLTNIGVSPTTSIRKSHCKCTPFQNGKVLTKNLCIASYRRIYILDKQERFLFLSILWCTNKTVQRLVGSLQSLQYSRQLEMRHVTKTAVCRSAERQTSGLHVLVISKKIAHVF